MITTYSGTTTGEGLLAEQCLKNIDQIAAPYIPPEKQKTATIETFAFPSQEIMLRLLALFAGRPKRIPEKHLLEEPENQEQAQQIKDFVSSVLQEKIIKETYGENNELIQEVRQAAIISNNPYVDGTTRIPGELFSYDLNKREEKLALYIKKTFGAEGLRHFLGLIIGLDVYGRNGMYHFTINEHLERLGYQKSKKGSYAPDLKRKALRIVEVLSSLYLTVSAKKGKREKISCIKLFTLERYDLDRDIESNQPLHMKFFIRASDSWYGQAFKETDDRSMQYTQLLKKIATENHLYHPLAISLTPQLAVRWRMNQFRPVLLKVSTLMEMCDLDYTTANRNRKRELLGLVSELNYMVQTGYMGNWFNKNPDVPLGDKQSVSNVLFLEAPEWLGKSMKQSGGKQHAQSVGKGTSTFSADGLRWIQQQAGLSQREMAEALGVTRQYLNALLNGRRKISGRLSNKITEIFGNPLDAVSTKPCPT
jgi:DNA-binding XRE family transcriptional regulator